MRGAIEYFDDRGSELLSAGGFDWSSTSGARQVSDLPSQLLSPQWRGAKPRVRNRSDIQRQVKDLPRTRSHRPAN